MLKGLELEMLVKSYVDELVKSVNPFSVWDVTRLIHYYRDNTVNHDEVRATVERYFYTNYFGQNNWTRTVGEHLPFTNKDGNKPQIYHRNDFNIKAYDPDRLDPNKHNTPFILGVKVNPFVSMSAQKSVSPNLPNLPRKVHYSNSNPGMPPISVVFAIKSKTKDIWLGRNTSKYHSTQYGRKVYFLSEATLTDSKNSITQAFKNWDRSEWEVKGYRLVEEK